MIMEQWNVLLVLVLESILSFMLLVRGEEYEKGANVTLTFNHQLQSSTTTYYCNIFVRGGSRPFVVNGRLEQDGLKTGQEGRFDFQLHETGKYLDIMLSISQIDTIDEGVYIVSIAEVYGGVTHPNTYEARVHVTYPPGRAECEFRTQPLPGSDWRTLLCTATTGNDGSGILTCVGNSKRLPYLQPVTINGSVISGEFWIDPSLEARCCSIDGVSVLIFDSKTCDHFVHSPQDQTSSASPYSHSAESTNTIPTTPQTASDDAASGNAPCHDHERELHVMNILFWTFIAVFAVIIMLYVVSVIRRRRSRNRRQLQATSEKRARSNRPKTAHTHGI